MTEKENYKFWVPIFAEDSTRLALQRWLTTHVGELIGSNMQSQYYVGDGWKMAADGGDQEYESMSWMFDTDDDPRVFVSAYSVTITQSSHALQFKLTWADARES
jgi:predicted 3-demethylubiquinone-9 3-methyltransferase (glyoxalase superfamily)